jgi:hypothetical protein
VPSLLWDNLPPPADQCRDTKAWCFCPIWISAGRPPQVQNTLEFQLSWSPL